MNVIKTILLCIYRLPFRELGILVLAGTAIFLILYCTTRGQKWQRPILRGLFFVYVLIIVCTTLLGRGESPVPRSVSLIPFASYIKYAQGNIEMLRESIMNIVLFYPLGLLLGGIASEKFPRKKMLAVAFSLSFFIEACQLIFNLGYAEVDDVIHNTLGTGLGMLVIYVVEKIVNFVKLQHKRSA